MVAHLAARYGMRLEDVLAHVGTDRSLGAPVLPSQPDACAEIVEAVEREFAMTLDDVLLRRTQLGLIDAQGTAAVAGHVAELMASHLGWDDETTRRAAASYADTVEQDRRRWRR
jgi:glycerol-3-phosphate dehydrogenase